MVAPINRSGNVAGELMPKNKDGGWRLPDEVDPPRKCICIPVPNEPAHRQAFFGALTQLGYQFNWERDDDHTALPVSVLWMGIVLEAMHKFYNEDETMCFNCGDLTDCLEPLFAAQAEIFQTMLNVQKYGSDVKPGVPMPPEMTAENLAEGTNPGCDLSITWAQAQQVTQYADDLIMAALEIAESATNDVEMLQVITSLPVLDELGADAIAGYIEMLLEGVAENYAAQYTPEYEDETACAIFCKAKTDCVISLDDIYSVFYDRVTERFGAPVTAFVTITDLMAYLVDQDIDGTIVADVLMMVVWGGGILAYAFLGDAGTKPLQVLLRLAVNDANDDYLILCTDCPEDWEYEEIVPGLADWDDYEQADKGLYDDGWESDPASTFNGTAIFGRETTAPFYCIDIEFEITDPMTGDQNQAVVGDLALANTWADSIGTNTTYTIPVAEVIDGLAIGFAPNDLGAGYPDFPGKTIRVKVRGSGYQPPELGG